MGKHRQKIKILSSCKGIIMKQGHQREKCKLGILKIYFKRLLLHGAETWTTTKREDSKIQLNF